MNRQEFIDRLFAKAREAGIEEYEAYFSSGDSFDVDILEGAIKEYSVSSASGMCFRGVYAGKMGYASTQIEDEEAIDMLVRGVIDNASLLETDDGESIFEGSKEYPELDTYNPEIEKIPAAQKIAQSRELETVTKAKDARVQRVDGCGVSSSRGETRIVNSKGMDISSKSSRYGAVVVPVVSEGDKVNYGFSLRFSRHPEKVRIDEIAAKAVERAVEGLGAESIPSGSYQCIFRNDTAGTLLATFSGVFSGESARKGMSLLKGREGERIASECVSLVDNPLLDDGPASSAFDAEGVAHFSKDVIRNGKFITLLHNRLTAKLLGAQTTGNAAKGGYAGKVTVGPTNFYIEPSETTPEELMKQVGNGILITDLMGMHSGANPISGDFSLGAKGFLIENGVRTKPIEQFTVAGNFFEILKNIRAVASDLELEQSSIAAPSLYIGEISVAGK